MKKNTLTKRTKQSLSTYFISDLHLHPSHPHLFKLFNDFINNIKDKAEALYILGDLFEFWIGDDIIDKPAGKPYLPILDGLKSLADSGTHIYFIQGNRDFLAKEKFAKRIGATLLPDHETIDLYGTTTLIMHGDTLCTDDKNYQRMRFLLRTRLVQKIYLLQSTEKRQRIANKTRNITQNETNKKSLMILDVNQQQVEKVIKKGGMGLLIHGHTHRPAEHEFQLDGKIVKRIVLGDWRDKACFLEVSQSAMKMVF